MAWIKLDDQWMDNPKIVEAGRDGRDMWLASITYCAKHLTDGYFHKNLLPMLAVMAGVDVAKCQQFARTLLDVGLWEAREDSYYVHDYLDYNPSKEQTESNRNARAEAGRAGGIAKASKMSSKLLAKDVAKSKQKSAPYPYPSPLKDSTAQDEQFSVIQRHIETLTGLPAEGEKSIKVINELKKIGATTEDITSGFNWLVGQGNVIKYWSSLVGPTKTAMLRRKQGNGYGKNGKSGKFTNYDKPPQPTADEIRKALEGVE